MCHSKYILSLGCSAWHNVQTFPVSQLCCLLNAFILQEAKGKLPIAETGNKKVTTNGTLEIPSVNPLSEHFLLRSS